jgi:hypothetical protein
VSLVKFFSKVSRHTLVVAIGAKQIDCGVLAGSGMGGQWQQGSLWQVRIDEADGNATPRQALTAALQRLCASPPDLPPVDQVRVVVADTWLAAASVPWSSSLGRAVTADPYTRAQLAVAGFELEPDDTLKLDDAPFGEPRMAIAYPAAMLAALGQLAKRLNARLSSVLPLSVAAWALAQHKHATRAQVLAVCDMGWMLFVRGAGKSHRRLGEVSVRVDASDALSATQGLSEAWQRLSLRDSQLDDMAQLAVLNLAESIASSSPVDSAFLAVDLPAPQPQADSVLVSPNLRLAATTSALRLALDALPGITAVTASQWLALGVAVLGAGTMTVQAIQENRNVQSLTTRLHAATNVARPAQHSVTWSREELARVLAVNAAIRELNMPISAIVRALQPPRDIHVAVLSMETSGTAPTAQTSSAKIVVEARTSADMTRYVAFLSERKPFTGAYLTRHEIDETSSERPYRFTVEALWSE